MMSTLQAKSPRQTTHRKCYNFQCSKYTLFVRNDASEKNTTEIILEHIKTRGKFQKTSKTDPSELYS